MTTAALAGWQGEGVRKPSEGLAMGVAAISAGVAAVAVAVAQLQLSGRPQADIWTNAWLDGALCLAGVGLLLAMVIFLQAVFGRERRQPDDRLLVYTVSAKPLLTDPSVGFQNPGVQVVYHSRPIAKPYLVSFSLLSRSRTDIRRTDFDGGRPLKFDLGTPITVLLDSSVPGTKDRIGEWFRIDGSSILIGPVLIRLGQSVRLKLLTEDLPNVNCDSDLAGVDVIEEAGRRTGRSERWRPAATILVIIALLVATNLTTWLLSHYLTSSGGTRIIPGPSKLASTPSAVSASGSPDMTLNSPQAGQAPPFQSAATVLTDPGSGGIHAVAYSPGGQYLATADGNGHFYIRTVATGKVVHDIADPNSLGVYAVVFSHNGSQFATGDGNGYVYLWSAAFGQIGALHDQNSGGVRAVAFSPDGKFVAAADGNGAAYIWNLANRQATLETDPDSFGVGAVAFSPDGYLASGDGNGHVFTWMNSSQPEDRHGKDSVAVRALAFSKDGRYLAAADLNGNTYIWDTRTWTVVSTPAVQATCGVNGIAFSLDSRYLAAADCDGHLYLWANMLSGTPSSPIAQSASADFQQTGGLTAVAFSSDGTHLAVGSSNGHLYEWTAPF